MPALARTQKSVYWIPLLVVLSLAAAFLLWREGNVFSAPDTTLEVVFSAPPGSYGEDIALRLSTANPQAAITFTLDGRRPDPALDARYERPIELRAGEAQVVVIRAQARLPDGSAGPVASGSYIMGLQHSLPVLSIIADPGDLWDEERGIYVNHQQRGREWERPVDLTYVTADGQTGFRSGAGLRIHGEWTRWFFDKKSLRLYFREAYGSRKLEYPLFGDEGQVAFDHLYLHNSDQDLLLFRNQLTERLFTQMGGFAVRGRPLLLFINGQPWGIYNIRERIDERFLNRAYGVAGAAVTDTPNIPSRQSAEQRATDLVHWENFMRFVQEKDLAAADNYAYLQTQIDLANFVDYYLLQMYIANTDWPHHNVHQFRPRTPGGRWEWIVWDNDLAYDAVDRQMVDHVLVANHPLGERMELLLNKLLDNPHFYNLFLTRAADLLNTTLSPENVGGEVERSLAELGGDVALEQARWNVPRAWEEVAAYMRDFAANRTDMMRRHFVESFQLPGIATIHVEQEGGPAGWLVVNELPPHVLPWQGQYFAGTTILLRAVPPAGYRFAAWQGYAGPDDPASAAITLPVAADARLVARFEPLEASLYQQHDVVISAYHADDEGEILGDWFELRVMRPGGVDLRGWRITDNDTPDATDEGSLVFADDPLLAGLPQGTTVRVIATANAANDAQFPADSRQNGLLTLYAGNGRLDGAQDPWFNLGARDNLLLLAPGAGETGERPVDLWSASETVRPSDFGLPPGRAS